MKRPDHTIVDAKRCPACGAEPPPVAYNFADQLSPLTLGHQPEADTIDVSNQDHGPDVLHMLWFRCRRCNARWPKEEEAT